MNDTSELARLEADIATLMQEKLGIGTGSLARTLRKAGRRLPKRVRVAGRDVVQGADMARHPKLARQVDVARVRKAAREVRLHLNTVDAADRRKGAILSLLSSIAFNLLAVAALWLAVARWQGWI